MSPVPSSPSDALVHLVGSMSLASAEDAFRACGPTLAHHVAALPDGETDYRRFWVHHIAYTVLYPHTDLTVVHRPASIDGEAAWYASSNEDQWIFEVRPGVEEVELGPLGYAEIAAHSYGLMRRLRDEGVLAPDVRLQVEIPFPDGGIGAFVRDERSLAILLPAYERAVVAELARLAEQVPAEELSIQWDVCWEVLYLEGVIPWSPGTDHWERYVGYVKGLGPHVPEGALAGYHLCYGDWEGRHMVEPGDLGLVVRMANAAAEHSGRPMDYVHMPVPIARDDPEYFAPLADLDRERIGRVFLGLVHAGDGVDGARRRVQAARTQLDSFGVSTECGMGRVPGGRTAELLKLHRAIAEEVLAP